MGVTVEADRAVVSKGFIARYGLLYLGQNIAWAAPANLLLANQILVWYPERKESMLGWLMAAGGLVSIFASPVAGWFSDRTATRLGRRTPWIIGGALVASVALLVAGAVGTLGAERRGFGFAVLVGAWMVFQFAINSSITPAQSVAPDRVPQCQFGTVSGVLGLAYTAGIVLGTGVAAGIGGSWAYAAIVAILLLALLPFLLVDREPSSAGMVVDDAPRARAVAPSPRQHPDFWWMFATRGLLTLAQAIVLFFLLYFLRDVIGHPDPDQGVLVLTGLYALCVVVTAVGSGIASDKVGRRKPFVLGSALGVAAACVGLMASRTFGAVIVAAVALGLSWGVYQAIDQALVNEVLPSERERATHMGVMNLAIALPNTLAPVVAAVAVQRLGGYSGLYLLAAVMAVVGGLLVMRIRGRR